jgi:hypothetical protein
MGYGSNPSRGKSFLFSTMSRPALGSIQHSIQWLPGLKRPEREADNSSPSSAKVKIGGATSLFLRISSWYSA